jgi:hypothetical protein
MFRHRRSRTALCVAASIVLSACFGGSASDELINDLFIERDFVGREVAVDEAADVYTVAQAAATLSLDKGVDREDLRAMERDRFSDLDQQLATSGIPVNFTAWELLRADASLRFLSNNQRDLIAQHFVEYLAASPEESASIVAANYLFVNESVQALLPPSQSIDAALETWKARHPLSCDDLEGQSASDGSIAVVAIVDPGLCSKQTYQDVYDRIRPILDAHQSADFWRADSCNTLDTVRSLDATLGYDDPSVIVVATAAMQEFVLDSFDLDVCSSLIARVAHDLGLEVRLSSGVIDYLTEVVRHGRAVEVDQLTDDLLGAMLFATSTNTSEVQAVGARYRDVDRTQRSVYIEWRAAGDRSVRAALDAYDLTAQPLGTYAVLASVAGGGDCPADDQELTRVARELDRVASSVPGAFVHAVRSQLVAIAERCDIAHDVAGLAAAELEWASSRSESAAPTETFWGAFAVVCALGSGAAKREVRRVADDMGDTATTRAITEFFALDVDRLRGDCD